MTTDIKELIELAAKAVGKDNIPHKSNGDDWRPMYSIWHPDTDGRDNRSLQVALDIAVIPYPIYGLPKHSVIAKQYQSGDMMREQNPTEVIERFCDHPSKESAYSMAVLRCAAEIQRRKENDNQTRS